jgi:hypothetical protein
MLFTAFRPQNLKEIKKVTNSDRSVAQWRDLRFSLFLAERL